MLAVLTTHPIQYQVPLWKSLSSRGKVPFRVLYMSELGCNRLFDPGFGRKLAWDIDLLGGYDHEFIDVWTGSSQESFFWLRLRSSLKDTLKNLGVKVLWIQGWQVAAYWQAVWEARRIQAHVWLRGETNLRSSAVGVARGIKRAARKRLFSCVDEFLCIGKANRQFYLSQGIVENRLVAAPYCIDNARFMAQASCLRSVRQKLRRQWQIPDNAFCFLFLGKFIPKKRPMDLVEAVRRLQQRTTKPVHILFAGAGELGQDLRRPCSIAFDAEGRSSDAAKSAPTASFLGFLNQTEVSKAYTAADCLVLPSDARETWGLVVNESMASGLPCVTSDACGCVEDLMLPICPDLTYPVGDVDRLRLCLESVMTTPPSISLLEKHINGYDMLRTVEVVEELYAKTAFLKPMTK